MSTRKVAEWKKETTSRIAQTLKTHDVVVAAKLAGVRASQLQQLRKRLRGKVEFVVARNTLAKKALDTQNGPSEALRNFFDKLDGSNVLLFTRHSPFSLLILLDKNKVKVPAKAGDVATHEIVVPAGNTGLSPGPVISEFGESRIPTKIESGTIWVAKDTIVARKGDTFSPRLASLLSKLGVKPIEMGLTLAGAYDRGHVLTQDDLQLDLGTYIGDVTQAARAAVAVSVEAEFVDSENIQLIVQKAFRESLALSVESAFLEPESTPALLSVAMSQARALSEKMRAVNPEAAPAVSGNA